MVIHAINSVINALAVAISSVIALLPPSPFTWDFSGINNSFLKFFLWFVPVDGLVSILTAYVGAVATYYGLRVILRWAKVAGE